MMQDLVLGDRLSKVVYCNLYHLSALVETRSSLGWSGTILNQSSLGCYGTRVSEYQSYDTRRGTELHNP